VPEDSVPLSPIVRDGLQLGLNFTPLPAYHAKKFTHNANFLSKKAQESSSNVLLLLDAIIPNIPLFYYNRDQNIARMFLKSPQLQKLLEEHIITDTDKNMGVAVVTKKWYYEMGNKLLSNRLEYKIMAHFVEENNVTYIDEIHSRYSSLDEYAYYKADKMIRDFKEINLPASIIKNLSPFDNQYKIAYFKVLPKVHKQPIGARPITASHSSFTVNASIILTAALGNLEKSLILKFPSIYLPIKNSKEAVARTRQAINLFKDTNIDDDMIKLKTFDFSALYTNLDLKVVHDNIFALCDMVEIESIDFDTKLPRQGEWNSNLSRNITEFPLDVTGTFTKVLLVKTLDLILRNNYFVFDKTLYLQISGIAMGTNFGPIVANLTLAYCEIKYWLDAHVMVFDNDTRFISMEFSSRYIDDLLIVYDSFIHNITDLQSSLTNVYQFYGGNKLALLETATENDTINNLNWTVFLDLRLNYSDATFNYRSFRKLGNAYLYPSFFSYISPAIKKGFIIGELIRLQRTNSRGIWFRNEIATFVKLLNARGYPDKFIWKCFDSYLRKFKKPSLETDFRVIVDFHGKSLVTTTQRYFDSSFPPERPQFVPRALPQISKIIKRIESSSDTHGVTPLEQRPRKVNKLSNT
jgi:hypothetical protein